MNLKDLLDAICADVEQPSLRSRSEGELFPCYAIPISVAKYIQHLDPDEEHVHIEYYEKHAELWRIFYWRESNSRRAKLKTQLAKETVVRDERKRIIEKIEFQIIDQLMFKPAQARTLATEIYNKRNEPRMLDIIKKLGIQL